MRRFAVIAALMCVASIAHAEQNQAFLAIQAETTVMKMAGMPAMPKIEMPAGMKMPEGVKMPSGPQMAMLSGEPTRSLNVRLWSPSIAPADAFAYITPPAGLKQGNKLDLELYRPKPEQTKDTPKTDGDDSFDPQSNPNFTIKIYWGSSETVKPGQPKVIKWTGLSADQQGEMEMQAKKLEAAQSYFYKENWTTGYWPTAKQPGEIAADASLVGDYALTTNYTGNVKIEAAKDVDFLAPITMSSPDIAGKIDFASFIPFKWKQIPNALGLYASIIGMEGENTLILWSSSEVYQENLMADLGFPQMAEVREFVKQTVFMKGDQTKVTVPAGIFKDSDTVMFSMYGYGPGAALDKAQPLPRIQTKTTLSIMLGGKDMPDMGGTDGDQ